MFYLLSNLLLAESREEITEETTRSSADLLGPRPGVVLPLGPGASGAGGAESRGTELAGSAPGTGSADDGPGSVSRVAHPGLQRGFVEVIEVDGALVLDDGVLHRCALQKNQRLLFLFMDKQFYKQSTC